jgi:hypothetical protein
MGFSPKSGEQLKIRRFIPLDYRLARLLGLYIAEGSVNEKQMSCVEFSFGDEPLLVYETIKLMKELFGVNAGVIASEAACRVLFSGRILANFFSSLCGMGAQNKRIPLDFLYGRLDLLKELVDYYFKGDGCRIGNEVTASTASRQLAFDLRMALLRLGFKPRVQKIKRKEGQGWDYVISYSLTNVGTQHANKSWFVGVKRKDGLSHYAVIIKKVEREPYTGEVYNLQIEDDETYTTKWFAVHNCEAMLCQKAPIVVNAPPMNEHVDKSCGWLVDYTSVEWENYLGIVDIKEHVYKPEAFAEAIIDALDHPEEIKEKGVKAYEKAVHKYNYLATYKRFLELE